jgi:hypothetical protein
MAASIAEENLAVAASAAAAWAEFAPCCASPEISRLTGRRGAFCWHRQSRKAFARQGNPSTLPVNGDRKLPEG